MARTSACPSADHLESLLLGHLPEAEAETCERHMQECGPCLGTLNGLLAEDTLAGELQAGAATIELRRDVEQDADELIGRLRSLSIGQWSYVRHDSLLCLKREKRL